MATSTHRITITDAGYTNASNGNLNCTVIAKTGTLLRCVIGGVEPAAGTEDYIEVNPSGGGGLSVTDLEAEDDVWIRADQGETSLSVIRGPAKVTLIA
jgi:hypothetical protein